MDKSSPNRRLRHEDVHLGDNGDSRPFLGVSALSAVAGPISDRIAAGETIRIGFANEIPFAHPGEDGSPKGFVNAAVIGFLVKMGHINIEAVETQWGGLIPGLTAGQFDIITGG